MENLLDVNETLNSSLDGILVNPPKGVKLLKQISSGTGSSVIYEGQNEDGDKIAFDIPKDESKIHFVLAKYHFLKRKIKHSIKDLFKLDKPDEVQDLKTVLKHHEYTVVTSFAKLDENSISKEMLENGQIAEEFAEGVPISSEDLPGNIKVLAIAGYLDFLCKLKKATGKILDVNFEDDVMVVWDEDNNVVKNTRIDASPWEKEEATAVRYIKDAIGRLLQIEGSPAFKKIETTSIEALTKTFKLSLLKTT